LVPTMSPSDIGQSLKSLKFNRINQSINFIVFFVLIEMTRIRKRTSTRGSWSNEAMTRAVAAVNSKEMGLIITAAKNFEVPRTTLRRHLNPRHHRRK